MRHAPPPTSAAHTDRIKLRASNIRTVESYEPTASLPGWWGEVWRAVTPPENVRRLVDVGVGGELVGEKGEGRVRASQDFRVRSSPPASFVRSGSSTIGEQEQKKGMRVCE
jgi:hypothetical protein